MKIALGQLDMVWEDKKASLVKAEQMVRMAAQGQADMILFPEMSLTGFSMNLHAVAEKGESSGSVAAMSEIAARYGVAVGFGWAALPESDGAKGTNRFTLIGPEGSVLAEYRKIHPFRYGGEADFYQGGEELVTVPWHGHTWGLFICYDLRFPEVFQLVSGQADILLVIANWPASRSDQWTALLKARAIENQSYIVGVNCVGSRNDLDYSGDSAVFDPIGTLLGTLHGQEGVLICEVIRPVCEFREKLQEKRDRREDLYIREYEKRYR